MFLGKGHEVLPVGDEHLVPLPLQYLRELRRPGAHNPVGVLTLRTVTGTAGESVDLVDAQLFCHEHCVVEIVVKGFCNLLVGMDGVAMAGKGADFQAGGRNGVLEVL